MALFKQKKVEKQNDTNNNTVVKDTSSDVLLKPCLTEKTIMLNNGNVYTFFVETKANKFMVKNAIKDLYKVTPVKVNIVNNRPAKRIVGRSGRKKHVSGFKKAYVFLKKGDSIDLS